MRLFLTLALLCAITQFTFAQDGVPPLGSSVLEIGDKLGAIVSFEATQVSPSAGTTDKRTPAHRITVVAKLGSALDLMPQLIKRMKNEISLSAFGFRILIMSTTSPGVVASVREYSEVSIGSLTFADFQASSTDPLQFTIEFAGGVLASRSGNGRTISIPAGATRQINKGSFRFEMGSLPTRAISTISSIRLHPVVTIDVGVMPNFGIRLPLANATPWSQWTTQQRSGSSPALTGVLSIFAENPNAAIATLTIVGIRSEQYSETSGPDGSLAQVRLSARTSSMTISR